MVVVSGGGVWAWVWVAAMVVLLLVFAGACLAFGDAAEARFGRKDPGQVVADEVAGMALTLVPLPWLVGVSGVWCAESPVLRGLWLVAVGFVAFRFFDVLKPPPARGLQRVPGGWGILLDDLFAGVYAAGALVLVGRLV
jgi:phosphatidylglycerophosphatase A